MKKSMEQRNVGRCMAGLCCMVMAFCGVISASAQQSMAANSASALPTVSTFAPNTFSALMPGMVAAHADAKPAGEEEVESPKRGKPGGEGVKVHGHWVLQAKNPDGTLGERREFENSLIMTGTAKQTASGSAIMAAILSGNLTVADMAIGIVQGTLTGDPSQYCVNVGVFNTTVSCNLFYSGSSTSFLSNPSMINSGAETGPVTIQGGMAKTVTFTPSAGIALSGNFTIPAGLTSISGVQSLYVGCVNSVFGAAIGATAVSNYSLTGVALFGSSDVGSSQCGYTGAPGFTDQVFVGALTSTSVPSGPMAVVPGQILQISFFLSFS